MRQSSRRDINNTPVYSMEESGSCSSIERAWMSFPGEETAQTLLSVIPSSPHFTLKGSFQIEHLPPAMKRYLSSTLLPKIQSQREKDSFRWGGSSEWEKLPQSMRSKFNPLLGGGDISIESHA